MMFIMQRVTFFCITIFLLLLKCTVSYCSTIGTIRKLNLSFVINFLVYIGLAMLFNIGYQNIGKISLVQHYTNYIVWYHLFMLALHTLFRTYMHAHLWTHTRTHMHTHTCIHTHTYTCARTYAHMHACVHNTCACTLLTVVCNLPWTMPCQETLNYSITSPFGWVDFM